MRNYSTFYNKSQDYIAIQFQHTQLVQNDHNNTRTEIQNDGKVLIRDPEYY